MLQFILVFLISQSVSVLLLLFNFITVISHFFKGRVVQKNIYKNLDNNKKENKTLLKQQSILQSLIS